MFLQMWNYNEKTETDDLKYLKTHKDLETETVDAEGFFLPYGENPFDGDEVAKRVCLDMIQSATDYIYIMTPYLVLDDEMIDNLTYAAKRGVEVRILLPHIYDKNLPIWLLVLIFRLTWKQELKSLNSSLDLSIPKLFWSMIRKLLLVR